MKDKHVAISVGGLALLIIVAAFYLGDSGDSKPAKGATSSPQPQAIVDRREFSSAPDPAPSRPSNVVRGAQPIEAPRDPAAEANPPTPATYHEFLRKPDWERDIITFAQRLDLKDEDKAVQLLGKVSTLPDEAAKVVAMEYATKLMPDQQYSQLRPTIYQLGTSEQLRETILLDVLTRSDTVRMPSLVELLRQPKNPGQEEIREILVAYLDQDFGDNVQQWDAAVKKWLVENPEE